MKSKVRHKGDLSESAYFDRKTDARSWARLIEVKIDEGKHPVESEARKQTEADLIDRCCLEVLSTEEIRERPKTTTWCVERALR